MQCVLIDDEPLALQILERYVEEIPDLEVVKTFENPLKAFQYLKTEKVDLVFMDIEMPLLTGIDLIKSLEKPPSIIFTTAYRDYAVESYELNIIDYLLKPIPFTRFFSAVNKFRELYKAPQVSKLDKTQDPLIQDHLYVNANKKYIKVHFEEILFVESLKDYIRINTTNQQIVTKDRISHFEEKLPTAFLRIHRSYIVNTAKISAFTALDVEIGTKEIPIGESYKKEVLSKLKGI